MPPFPSLEAQRRGVRAVKSILSYQHWWKKKMRCLGITHVVFGDLRRLAIALKSHAMEISDADLIEVLKIVRALGLVRNGIAGHSEKALRDCMQGYYYARKVMYRMHLCPASFHGIRCYEELAYAIRRSSVDDVQSVLFLIQQHSW